MSILNVKNSLPFVLSIDVIKFWKGDEIFFDFVSVVIVSVEYVEYLGCSCVGFVCVVVCSEKNDWDVEILFVAANVIVSPRLDLFFCETGTCITTVDVEDSYLYVFVDDGGSVFGFVTADRFGVLAGLKFLFLYNAI